MIPMHLKHLSIVLVNIAIIGTIAMHFIPNQQTEAQTTADRTIIEQLKVETAKQNQIQQNKQQAITKQLALKKQHELKRLAEKTRTDGFNFNGYHYDIQWFSGDGRVPANKYIYRWDELPNHYLIEKDGAAGESIWNIQIGTIIIIDGKNYTCYKILHHIDPYAGYKIVLNEKANISAQTCENDDDLGPLTIWFFN